MNLATSRLQSTEPLEVASRHCLAAHSRGDLLGKRPFFFWGPVTHRPRRHGERRPLSEPKHDTEKKHCRLTADCTCQQGGGHPDNAADDQPNSRAEPVAHSTTDNLEDELWIGKSGVHKPDLRVGQKFVLRILEVPRRPRIWGRLSPCRWANRILHFLCWPFFQRIMVSIGTKSAVLPFRRQNAEAVVTKRSKPRPFRFPVSRGTVWRESPPLPRTWPRTITTTPESPGY